MEIEFEKDYLRELYEEGKIKILLINCEMQIELRIYFYLKV
jgi:hypothetical protein